MKAKQYVLVECGGAHVALGVFSVARGASGALRLEAYGRENFVSAPERSAAWPAQVSAALVSLAERLGLGGAEQYECRLALPGHLALTKCARTPAVGAANVGQALRFEAMQQIPFPLEKVAWDARATAQTREEISLLLAAARLDALEPLLDTVGEAVGGSPTHCEPEALALWRGLGPELGSEPAWIVDVGARSTGVLVGGGNSGDDGPRYVRTLNLGTNSVTAAIANRLGCDFAEAESAKRLVMREVAQHAVTGGTGPPPRSASEALLAEAVEQAARDFLEKLGAELLLTQLAYSRQPGALLPTRLYVCGGGAELAGLPTAMSERLGLSLVAFPTQPRALDLAGSRRVPTAARRDANTLFVLYGLARSVEHAAAQTLNLLPWPRRAAQQLRTRRPRWLLAAALLALAPLPFVVSQHRALAQSRAQLEAVNAALAPVLRLSASNTAAQAELSAVKEQLAQGRALNAARGRWLGFLADLETRLNEVGDIWLERLDYAPPANAATGDTEAALLAAAGRVALGGWVLEIRRSDETMQRLFDALLGSDFVLGIERERYDRPRPGLLRFDAELVINPQTPLSL